MIAKGQKLNDGKWHHVAVSMPKKDCRLSEVQFYVDGQRVESKVVGQDNRINVSLANKVTIGGLGHGTGKTPFSKLIHVEHGIKPFVGSLDEVSVWALRLPPQKSPSWRNKESDEIRVNMTSRGSVDKRQSAMPECFISILKRTLPLPIGRCSVSTVPRQSVRERDRDSGRPLQSFLP